jgi:hypothetical protein
VRLAEVEAPVALESAELCGLGGTHVPFSTATLNALYPSKQAYLAKVTAASNAAVAAGFLLGADAAQVVDAAERSIYGRRLECGPLCADERQFPSHPSSMLLSKQTAHLVIKDGASLVSLMDAATKLIAEGYTLGDTAQGKRKFAAAAARIDAYIDRTRQFRTKGNISSETESLLVTQATTLRDLVKGRSQ